MALSIILALLGFFLLLALIILWRTMRLRPEEADAILCEAGPVDEGRAAASLSGALKFRTVSNENPAQVDIEQFNRFRSFLEQTFPRVYTALEQESVNTHSLLYRWKGTDPSRKPVLFMAHYDVVPVDAGMEAKWTHPPFSGEIVDGIIWGRGALDIKCQVTGILEAVESLLEEGFLPGRDIYIAFGHDEEIDGQEGARHIAELLEKRGLEFDFILDEGSFIAENIIPGGKKAPGTDRHL